MDATEILHGGDVGGALAQLLKEVRSDPSSARLRTFLFQLSAVAGDWDRAAAQLAVVGQLDAKSLPMVQTYRAALECEALRRAVFAGEKTPLLFGAPEEWVAWLLEALRLSALGKFAEAAQTRTRAFDAAPASAGTMDGKSFAWLADCDSRFGPICEAVINGKYYWLPFHRLQKIEFDAPVDLRDSVWTPATLTLRNGGQTVALIPTRYPGSEAGTDDLVRLARKTDWVEVADASFHGVGQRMLATDEGEYPMMDVRVIEFLPDAAESGTAV